jgi:hypothetical protein
MIDFADNWDMNLKQLVKRRFKNYEDLVIDLSTARTLDLKSVPGDFLAVISATSKAANCEIRFNKQDNVPITLICGKTIQTIFTGFYLSNTAQAGASITIRIGIIYVENDLPRRATAKSVLTVTNVAANTDTQAAANYCDQALIKASNKNTDIVWVNFGAAAVQNSCLPLEPGESIAIDIDNTSAFHCNFTVANEKAFIVFEV